MLFGNELKVNFEGWFILMITIIFFTKHGNFKKSIYTNIYGRHDEKEA